MPDKQDIALATDVVNRTPELALELRDKADRKLFTERWTVEEDYIARQEHWWHSRPQNTEEAGAVSKRILALKPRVGSELIQARINVESLAYLVHIDPKSKSVVHWERFPYPNIERFITGSDKVTEAFGYWPSFHDAEVLSVRIERGDMQPEKNVWIFPSFVADLEHWEMTDKVNEAGYFVLSKKTITTLKFHQIDKLQLKHFNHQNAILGLEIHRMGSDGPSLFAVKFDAAFGMDASFECGSIEVISSLPKAVAAS